MRKVRFEFERIALNHSSSWRSLCLCVSPLSVFLCASLLAASACAPSGLPKRQAAPPQPVRAKERRDGAIVVRGSAAVPDEALDAAAARVDRMLAHAPKVRENLERARFEVLVAARTELMSDLTEFRHRRGSRARGEDFDEHTRGGGHQERRFTGCATGNLLGDVGDCHYRHDICVHELAHGIYWAGLAPGVRARVLERHRASIASGRWKSAYAATDHAEFFAELSMWYFGSEGGASPEVPKGRGPEWLRAYDPESFALLDAIDQGRTDPGSAQKTPLSARASEGARSVAGELPVVLLFSNRTRTPLRVEWIDYGGVRKQPFSIAANDEGEAFTFATHAFAVTDESGRERGVYVAGETDGVVTIDE